MLTWIDQELSTHPLHPIPSLFKLHHQDSQIGLSTLPSQEPPSPPTMGDTRGGCCPPMDLFRSEPMQLVQLIIPIESAHRTISYLGDLGLLQFKDVPLPLSFLLLLFDLDVPFFLLLFNHHFQLRILSWCLDWTWMNPVVFFKLILLYCDVFLLMFWGSRFSWICWNYSWFLIAFLFWVSI